MRALRLRALPPLLFALAVPRLAGAEDCTTTRPTDPAGVRGYAYGNVQVQSFATAHIRVWYTLEGANAVRAATTRADQVPDDVALSANVTEEAYQKYADMKFRAPVSDASHPACVTNGGDGKTDVYLLHFTAADGQTIAEQCKGTPKVCSGFILADARFDKTYKTFEEGARTVLPHELFHAVQEAYDGEMDGYWSEGTAQWAAKVVSPNIHDLERFLPEFFKDPSRSLGTSPGGSAAAYLYSTAIWPVFLSSRFGNDVVREMLDEQGKAHGASIDAVSSVLLAHRSSLAAEYPLFMVYNLGTSSRAGSGGYANGASYPKLPAEDFPGEGTATGITAGLSAKIYRVNAAAPTEFVLESDPERNRGMLVPVKEGITQVGEAKALPATVTGEAFVVVAGVTSKKSDAPYTLRTQAPQAGGADAGVPKASSSGDPGGESGGCALSESPRHGVSATMTLGALGFFFALGRRRRRMIR